MNKFKITYINDSELSESPTEIIEKADLSLNFPHSAVFRTFDETTRNWNTNALVIPWTSIKKIEKLD